jgi:hypothetical protein
MQGDVLMLAAFYWFTLVWFGAIAVVLFWVYLNIAPLLGIVP